MDYVQKNGAIPTKRQLNEDALMPSDMAYRKEFGSWGNAIRECGFDVKKPYPSDKCIQAVSRAKKAKLEILVLLGKAENILINLDMYIFGTAISGDMKGNTVS